MVSDFTPQVTKNIRDFYNADGNAQALFDWSATRERDATTTSIDRMCQVLKINRGAAVAMAKQLEELGCGDFIAGRHSQKSRFRWKYSCISLGKAASGEQVELAAAVNPIPENEEENVDQENFPTSVAPQIVKLTIAEAKVGLSNMFGVPSANIEITIKS
jgi:hypothetical protein